MLKAFVVYAPGKSQLSDLREAAQALSLQVKDFRVSDDAAIDKAFETIASQNIGALIVVAGPFFDTRRDKIVALAARHAVPTCQVPRGMIGGGNNCKNLTRQCSLLAQSRHP